MAEKMTHQRFHEICNQKMLKKVGRIKFFEQLAGDERSSFWNSLSKEVEEKNLNLRKAFKNEDRRN